MTESTTAPIRLYMSMSLDGFISGPGDDMNNPFGTGGERLHDWLRDDGPDVAAHRPGDGPSRILFDELTVTGAVITGRRTGDFVDYWGGDHHEGVPIFVPTHRPPAENHHQNTLIRSPGSSEPGIRPPQMCSTMGDPRLPVPVRMVSDITECGGCWALVWPA